MSPEQKMELLARPFASHEVKWKPQSVKGDRALAIAYIDARAVMDRLDEVLGPGGWQDSYVVIDHGSAVCKLRCKLSDGPDGWVERVDVGSESEQPDAGDRCKSAFSDALKRAAVKFGVGRYLYRLPHQWANYDAQKKRFADPGPRLPDWAIPKPTSPVVSEEDVAELLGLAGEKGYSREEVMKAAGKPVEQLTKTEAKALWNRIKAAAGKKVAP